MIKYALYTTAYEVADRNVGSTHDIEQELLGQDWGKPVKLYADKDEALTALAKYTNTAKRTRWITKLIEGTAAMIDESEYYDDADDDADDEVDTLKSSIGITFARWDTDIFEEATGA